MPRMQRWVTTEFGTNFDAIEMQEAPDPGEPGPGEALVEIGAAGLSLTDLVLMMGAYPGMEHVLPHPLCAEFAGTVRAVGDGVGGLSVGDRVTGGVFPPQGAASQYVVVDAANVAVLPEGVSLEEGAAVPAAYATAHAALHRQANMQAGERVLVLAGASALGLACIQLARLAGAKPYGAASAEKLDAVLAAGAEDAYDYRVEGWSDALPVFDIILDPIGGESFQRSYELLAPGGRLLCLDAIDRYPGPGETDYRSEPGDPRFDPIDLIKEAKTIIGVNMPELWPADGGARRLLEEAMAYFGQDGVRPVIARTFAFDQIAEAFRFLHDRRSVGRIILTRAGGDSDG
jgi:NADPH:quinone reductase-like Zn-dependent oxidoreductase